MPLLLPLTLLYICVAHTSRPRTCISQQNYSHPDMKAEIIFLDQTLICFFPSCGICFCFLHFILAHHNFAGVRNLHCSRHFTTASARFCLCRRSRQGRSRQYTFSLSLLRQRQRLQETRTSPFLQPLPHDSHPQSTLPHTRPLSSSSFSATPSTNAPTSQIGKRAGPANSHIGNDKKTQNPPPPSPPVRGNWRHGRGFQ